MHAWFGIRNGNVIVSNLNASITSLNIIYIYRNQKTLLALTVTAASLELDLSTWYPSTNPIVRMTNRNHSNMVGKSKCVHVLAPSEDQLYILMYATVSSIPSNTYRYLSCPGFRFADICIETYLITRLFMAFRGWFGDDFHINLFFFYKTKFICSCKCAKTKYLEFSGEIWAWYNVTNIKEYVDIKEYSLISQLYHVLNV